MTRINAWQETIGLHDEHGRPFRFTAHQLRHTYGTRLINADVPQEVVRRLLDHDSLDMTARYARLNDQTIRRHWERARKINIHGETVVLEQGSPLSCRGDPAMALPSARDAVPDALTRRRRGFDLLPDSSGEQVGLADRW
jgi:hypothetical protein